MREAKPLAGPAGAKPKGDIAPILTGVEADRIAIVNGRYEPGWSDIKAGDPGVAIAELFKFLADNPDYPAGADARQRRSRLLAQHRLHERRRGAARQAAASPSRSISRMYFPAMPAAQCIRARW